MRKRTPKAGVLSEMRLILQIGAHFRRDAAKAQRNAPGSGDVIIGDAKMDSVVPEVKLEGEQETTGCRLIWAVADKVKNGSGMRQLPVQR